MWGDDSILGVISEIELLIANINRYYLTFNSEYSKIDSIIQLIKKTYNINNINRKLIKKSIDTIIKKIDTVIDKIQISVPNANTHTYSDTLKKIETIVESIFPEDDDS